MRTSTWAIVVIVLIILGGIIWWAVGTPTSPGTSATTTPSGQTTLETTTTPQGLTFTLPASFALATGSEPITVSSYIPPCNQGYDYCLYENNNEFPGTNFESAGLSITARPDLASQSACLNTPPAGYDSSVAPSSTSNGTGYAASVFADLGGAAAGHESTDSYYRLYQTANGACTEFDARVAQTDYGNYPPGQIQEFTSADEQTVESGLQSILSGMTLHGSAVVWPSNS